MTLTYKKPSQFSDATVTALQTKLLKIGARTSYGEFSVAKEHTVLNRHSFDDYSLLNASVGGAGYGVFDASPNMIGDVHNNHLIGFQSRLAYNAGGNLTGVDGLTGMLIQNTHNGAGLITNNFGIKINGTSGTGPITNSYGIYMDLPLTATTLNYAIYCVRGNSYLGGNLEMLGIIQLTKASNSNIKTGTGWIWTSTGLASGTSSGGIYEASGALKLFSGDNISTPQFVIASSGNIGIRIASPTAYLHLPASTAAANTASLKITPGVLATTPVSGNIESDGTHLYWTNSAGTRIQLDN